MNKTAKLILEFAQGLGELADEIITTPRGKLRINKIPNTTYWRTVEKLKKDGLIRKPKYSAKNVLEITQRGSDLLNSFVHPTKRTDGLSTILFFDIPESKSKHRMRFRRFLLKHGYHQLQKSVFISGTVFSNEIKKVITELGLQNSVKVVSGKIDNI